MIYTVQFRWRVLVMQPPGCTTRGRLPLTERGVLLLLCYSECGNVPLSCALCTCLDSARAWAFGNRKAGSQWVSRCWCAKRKNDGAPCFPLLRQTWSQRLSRSVCHYAALFLSQGACFEGVVLLSLWDSVVVHVQVCSDFFFCSVTQNEGWG